MSFLLLRTGVRSSHTTFRLLVKLKYDIEILSLLCLKTYKTMVLKIVTFTTADEAGVPHIGLGSPLKENKVIDHELSSLV